MFDFLFPQRSLSGTEGFLITEEERKQLSICPVVEMESILRERGLKWIDCIRAAMPYDSSPLMKKAVHLLKYKRARKVHVYLAELIARSLQGISIDPSAVLCPVPLHWSRQFQRGFNQAELLARAVGAAINLPVRNILRRTRATGYQARRGRKERLMAVQDAFQVRHNIDLPRIVILIDDLSTTGATFDACAKILKNSGVKRVEGWAVAHG